MVRVAVGLGPDQFLQSHPREGSMETSKFFPVLVQHSAHIREWDIYMGGDRQGSIYLKSYRILGWRNQGQAFRLSQVNF